MLFTQKNKDDHFMLKRMFLISICTILFSAKIVSAAEIKDQVENITTDAEGLKDASSKVLKKDSRIVPVPIPIANPTIGTGLAVGLLYIHPTKSSEPDAPTSTTGVGGLYTDTGTWAVAAFHSGYYKDDSIRLVIPLGYGEFNLDFYGVGQDSPFRDNPIKYKAVSGGMFPRLLFELPWENWFLGGKYALVNIDVQSDIFDSLPGDRGAGVQTQTAGLGLVSVYDSRNSNYWPSKGSWLDLSATFYGEYAGGDYNYIKTVSKFAQYFPLMDPVTFVYRLDGQVVDGDAPFWDLSRIRLRGYSGGQFLDDVAVTAQAEIRWNFYRRWTALGFGGGGRIADSISDLGGAKTNSAVGGGLRYMLIEKQKLSLGLDVAYAENANVSLYFQVGDWLAQ